MLDRIMSSNASTSTSATNRRFMATSSGINGQKSLSAGSKCRCCPYGFHIDLGFVSYAQDVSNGFVSRQGTPTQRFAAQNGDRQLMSPMESIFSDSLENIMSDFEEALAPHKSTSTNSNSHTSNDVNDVKNRYHNGYSSDYTSYRRGPSSEKKSNFEIAPPSSVKAPPRQSSLNHYSNGSRSNTPTFTSKTNGYSTALGKAVSEIRARNAESPFPGEYSNSRVGTPIDLGIAGNGVSRDLPPTPTPTFRRAPSQTDVFNGSRNNSASAQISNGFASLRRGREFSLPEAEPPTRARFFSASPKMPRRLQVAPTIDESHFTYSSNNGNTVLSRTQATCTSPMPVEIEKSTRSVGVTTGPIPPAKPCSDCPDLRKQLEEVLKRIPPPKPQMVDAENETDSKTFEDKAIGEAIRQITIAIGTDLPDTVDAETSMDILAQLHIETQTDKPITVDTASSPIIFDTLATSSQTDELEETADNVKVEQKCFAIQTDCNEPRECEECLKRQDVFTRHVGVGACSIQDKICVNCDKDVEEIDENEAPGFKVEPDDQKQREFEIAKANAVKKLLTNENKSAFQRGTVLSKSARFDRKRSVDDLDYIIDKKTSQSTPQPSSIPSTPTSENSEALTAKVVLKKEQNSSPIAATSPPEPLSVPEPVPARIPRPKFSKWATPEECAETPDEQEEAQDRLTPLRSELRLMSTRWRMPPPPPPSAHHLEYAMEDNEIHHQDFSDSDAESDCSAHTDGTFEVHDDEFDGVQFEIFDELRTALENVNSNLLDPGSVDDETVTSSEKLVQHEWMKIAARKTSKIEHVDSFVEELRNYGPKLVQNVVNMSDGNGNTALHYAVSHANFAVVSTILDCGECDINLPNRAGYTAVMLAALSSLEDDVEQAVVHRLFQMGDVNAKATQHGQTALMLAVSHGKKETTELLLQCGANVNIQDEEGSTALMCAAEHGHRELVKLLLAEPTIDASLTDCDSSTALSIAVENGHRDIGVLIYAHLNYAKLDAAGQPTSTI